jgi:amino-acid N-acetyltransferase
MDDVIAPAGMSDLPAVAGLLEASGLPSRDVSAAMLEHYLVARRGTALVGVIGLEPLGDVGLLRSAAVAAAERGRGLGVALTRELERRARAVGIRRVFLLTTTAEAFFARLGYAPVPRDQAPPAIQGTTEYRELCAATAVVMARDLE